MSFSLDPGRTLSPTFAKPCGVVAAVDCNGAEPNAAYLHTAPVRSFGLGLMNPRVFIAAPLVASMPPALVRKFLADSKKQLEAGVQTDRFQKEGEGGRFLKGNRPAFFLGTVDMRTNVCYDEGV